MSVLLWFAIIYANQKNIKCKMLFILMKHQYHGMIQLSPILTSSSEYQSYFLQKLGSLNKELKATMNRWQLDFKTNWIVT